MFESYDIHRRERMTLHCAVTLQSPLSHIGEVQGNVSNLKTVKLLDFEGSPRSCFAYSGNALRNGILRRVGTASALESLGLTVNPDIHHTLFAGGRIDGSTTNDMDLDCRIRQLMPWLSVLGTAKPVGVFGSKGSQMVPGRIAVGSAYLVCYESAALIFQQCPALLPAELLPDVERLIECRKAVSQDPFASPDPDAVTDWLRVKQDLLPVVRKGLRTWTEYLTIDQTTRRDSTQDPTLQRFLPVAEGQLSLIDSKPKKEKEDKEKKSNQMIASDRLIMAGSRLYSRWDLNTTEVETGWIVQTLLDFAQSPYLGGKSNRGNGLVTLDFWFQKGSDSGHFLSVKTGAQTLSAGAEMARTAYQGYLNQYQRYLAESAKSNELAGFLSAS